MAKGARSNNKKILRNSRREVVLHSSFHEDAEKLKNQAMQKVLDNGKLAKKAATDLMEIENPEASAMDLMETDAVEESLVDTDRVKNTVFSHTITKKKKIGQNKKNFAKFKGSKNKVGKKKRGKRS